MNRGFAALWLMSGGIAALWVIHWGCAFGEAITRELGHQIIHYLTHDQENHQ